MRKERKIMIVLRDVGVDSYINMDMPEVDMNDLDGHKDLPKEL